jgi:hypothetical protein
LVAGSSPPAPAKDKACNIHVLQALSIIFFKGDFQEVGCILVVFKISFCKSLFFIGNFQPLKLLFFACQY